MYGLDIEFACALAVWVCAIGGVAWFIELAAGRRR